MFRHVSQSGQTLGNISEKHRETSNVSEFGRKHFCFPGSKFCFCNNVSTGGQTWKHLRKHRESQMFPQQCFLVCQGFKTPIYFLQSIFYTLLPLQQYPRYDEWLPETEKKVKLLISRTKSSNWQIELCEV
jgi:hypothetical protein